MLNRISYFLVVTLFFSLALSACVSVDSRISSEPINKEWTLGISGDFLNQASYHSEGGSLMPVYDNLAKLLNVPAHDADQVRISFEPDGSMKMTWLIGNKEKASRFYLRKNGLAVASDGVIDLPNIGSLSNGEDVNGHHPMKVRIFINTNGDLVTIQSGGAGQMFVIPLVIYAKHLAIFPRKK